MSPERRTQPNSTLGLRKKPLRRTEFRRAVKSPDSATSLSVETPATVRRSNTFEDDIDQLTIQIDALEGELRHLFDEPTP